MRLLVWCALLVALLSLLIAAALAVEEAANGPRLQGLDAAFTPGDCEQPCWRGMQLGKVRLAGVPDALRAMPDVTPATSDQCLTCWTMTTEGIQWHGAVITLNNPPDFQIRLGADPGETKFRLLDAIAVFGPPDHVQCAVFDFDPHRTSLMAYVTLYYKSGINVGSYAQLTSFDGALDPLWMVDEVTYQRPPQTPDPVVFPWRGFKHVTGRQCQPGG